MPFSRACTLFLACLLVSGCGAPSVPPAASVAITNAHIVDVSGDSISHAQTVLIRDSTIVGIGRYQIPESVTVVDAQGGYLIPGLRDMHVHQAGRYASLFVAHGVTFVRDMWGSMASSDLLAADREQGKVVPDFTMAGNLIDGVPPSMQGVNLVRTEADAVALVDSLADAGVPFLKVYDSLTPSVYDALVATAARRGLPVVGHVPMRVSVRHVVRSGQRSIEHANNLLKGCSDAEPEILSLSQRLLVSMERGAMPSALEAFTAIAHRVVGSYDPARCRDLFQLLDSANTWVTPTLVAVRGTWFRDDPAVRDDPRLAYLFDETKATWPPEAGIARFFTPETWAAGQATYEQSRIVVGELAKSGGRILAGSDTGAPYVYPGWGLQDELAELVAAGLSPGRALRAATVDAASFLGREDDPGSIQVGARADIVLLGSDPLADIEAVRDIRAVVLRGRVLDREQLDSLINDAEAAVLKSGQAAG